MAGLLEEDQRLFRTETPAIDLATNQTEDDSDPAIQELLEEIDRSLKGYEQATRSHT